MKKSILLGALGLLFGLGVSSAAVPKPRNHNEDLSARAGVSIIPLRHEAGFAVMVDKERPGNSVVIISNQDESYNFKDLLTKNSTSEKKYNLSKLDAGNYIVEVVTKGHDIKTNFYVYNKPSGKVIFVK
ncbi:MAG TPA: hypothetical protein VHS53_07865 [Mucilaginibacter sp.]|jgi:hypothetical protein|nr:hypothetical protein [Mucilaginibacter sp.]HWD86967.1 hypothetical protein [Mucilaginibacter sp.]